MVSQKALLFPSFLGHIHSNARAKNKPLCLLQNWFASLKAKTLFLLPAEIAAFVSLSEIIKKHVKQREMCFSQVFLKPLSITSQSYEIILHYSKHLFLFPNRASLFLFKEIILTKLK